jgi:hypothetical protein
MNAWITNWLAGVKTYTTQQLLTPIFPGGPVMIPKTFSSATGTFTGDLAAALPQLRYQGVDSNLLGQVASWAAGIWPTFNWAGAINTSCTVIPSGDIVCQ